MFVHKSRGNLSSAVLEQEPRRHSSMEYSLPVKGLPTNPGSIFHPTAYKDCLTQL